MKISAKHIIGISVAVTLFAGGVVPNANARAQEDPNCPRVACPHDPFGGDDCSSIGPTGACMANSEYCYRSLQFAVCSNLECGGGALCYWS